ncbi:MAG: hypothetical protein HQ478_10990 [Chloroflexi bacterium]|nr:hypothetical protein [Chloroflexota bacterium]
MGRRHSVPVWLLHSATDSRTQTKRLAVRTVEEADGSEATVAIVDDQARNFDDVRRGDADQVFSIQTTGGKNATIASAHRRLWVATLETAG